MVTSKSRAKAWTTARARQKHCYQQEQGKSIVTSKSKAKAWTKQEQGKSIDNSRARRQKTVTSKSNAKAWSLVKIKKAKGMVTM
jgi:hypothetical protein